MAEEKILIENEEDVENLLSLTETVSADDFIQPNEFVRVKTDDYVEYDIHKGQYVFVTNLQAFPLNKEDVYLQRLYGICMKVDKDNHIVTDEGVYIMNPNNLKKIGLKKQKMLHKIMRKDFSPDMAVN